MSYQTQNLVLKLYIPTTVYDKEIDKVELDIRFVDGQTLFNSLFGGCTLFDKTPVRGSYVSNDGTIIKEELYILESQVSESRYNELKDELKRGMDILKELWEQESLTLKVTRQEEYLFF